MLMSLVFGQEGDTLALVPKPLKPVGYFGINRPIVKFSELLAKHKGQQDWQEVVIDDDQLTLSYILMAPGTKTLKRYRPQTHEWWVVKDGQIRFEIEGQQPFIASPGWIVQVPKLTVYSMETIGDKPSLRLEVNIAKAQIAYPSDIKPPAIPGSDWMLVKTQRTPGPYDRGNKPFVIFNEFAANLEKERARGKHPSGWTVVNDRGIGNLIYGYERDSPPPGPEAKGHWHPECAEVWFVMTGQIKFKIEGQPTFIGDKGDIVYAPRFMWHLATFAGPGPSCRFAMTGYPGVTHFFEP
jgi:mannose-6-phosphate isomerase-like protein (cupin superfamily)